MYILEQIGIGELSDERLSFFRAMGVDSVHLELRGGKPQAGAKVRLSLIHISETTRPY